jgi:hypothetical protein
MLSLPVSTKADQLHLGKNLFVECRKREAMQTGTTRNLGDGNLPPPQAHFRVAALIHRMVGVAANLGTVVCAVVAHLAGRELLHAFPARDIHAQHVLGIVAGVAFVGHSLFGPLVPFDPGRNPGRLAPALHQSGEYFRRQHHRLTACKQLRDAAVKVLRRWLSQNGHVKDAIQLQPVD